MDPMMDNYRFLARYNTWFNARLFDACERLDDAARKRPAARSSAPSMPR